MNAEQAWHHARAHDDTSHVGLRSDRFCMFLLRVCQHACKVPGTNKHWHERGELTLKERRHELRSSGGKLRSIKIINHASALQPTTAYFPAALPKYLCFEGLWGLSKHKGAICCEERMDYPICWVGHLARNPAMRNAHSPPKMPTNLRLLTTLPPHQNMH